MKVEEIQKLLDQLSESYDALDILRKSELDSVNKVMPPEVRQEIDAVHAEYAPKVSTAMNRIHGLEGLILGEVIKHEATISGRRHKAIFQRGKITWDTKKLNELSQRFYQILGAKKQGKSSARITRV